MNLRILLKSVCLWKPLIKNKIWTQFSNLALIVRTGRSRAYSIDVTASTCKYTRFTFGTLLLDLTWNTFKSRCVFVLLPKYMFLFLFEFSMWNRNHRLVDPEVTCLVLFHSCWAGWEARPRADGPPSTSPPTPPSAPALTCCWAAERNSTTERNLRFHREERK